MMPILTLRRISAGFAFSTIAAVPALALTPQAATPFEPQAVAPYQLSVFAAAPAGLSAPDSIAVRNGHVFVGYGDGHAPDGSDGLNTQIVDFGPDGSVVHIYTVPGHSDGLKVDGFGQFLWALQNEDANANLVIINPDTQQQALYQFASPAPHGGGYDDIVFQGCKVFISASNPANNPNNGPAIVQASLSPGFVNVTPVLSASASAIDIPTDATVTLNLQDPDSMTMDPLGDIVLDSQGDQELIIVSHPTEPDQRVLRLPLSYMAAGVQTPVEVDDTNFATSSQGYILFADKGLNTVYKLSKQAFAPGAAYTAADGGPFVGTLDMTSGIITPVVTGLQGPGGLVFVDTSPRPPFPGHAAPQDWTACQP